MVTRRVAVYLGRRDQLTPLYILSFICDRWRRAGIEVVLLDDPSRRVDAEVAIVHVDATRRPAAYDALLEHYPRVINGRVRDISKRHISANLLSPATTYRGPVIVKTDTNCFDLPDSRPRRRRVGTLRRLMSRVATRLLRITVGDIRRTRSYPIFETPGRVPWHVWRDRRLVVEKFLPERSDDLYCLRSWMFFGTREKVSLHRSANPVVKRVNFIESEFITEVPEVIREARRRFGFDYGKFDFVLHEGQAVLLDTNSTPGCGGQSTPRLEAIADELAAGLVEAAKPEEHSAGAR